MKTEYFLEQFAIAAQGVMKVLFLKTCFTGTKNVQIVILYTVVKMDFLSVEFQLVMD